MYIFTRDYNRKPHLSVENILFCDFQIHIPISCDWLLLIWILYCVFRRLLSAVFLFEEEKMRRGYENKNLRDGKKIPVFKNVVFALRLVWKADKRLLLSYLYSNIIDNVFQYYIQSILFLKILLSIIDSGADFSVYSRKLLAFFGVTVFVKISVWASAYIRQVSTKNVLKVLNNMVFEC